MNAAVVLLLDANRKAETVHRESNYMTEKESLLSQLEMSEHAYAAARQNTAWDIAQRHAEQTAHLCRRLELLETQTTQEQSWAKMPDIKPLEPVMSAEELAARLK